MWVFQYAKQKLESKTRKPTPPTGRNLGSTWAHVKKQFGKKKTQFYPQASSTRSWRMWERWSRIFPIADGSSLGEPELHQALLPLPKPTPKTEKVLGIAQALAKTQFRKGQTPLFPQACSTRFWSRWERWCGTSLIADGSSQ